MLENLLSAFLGFLFVLLFGVSIFVVFSLVIDLGILGFLLGFLVIVVIIVCMLTLISIIKNNS